MAEEQKNTEVNEPKEKQNAAVTFLKNRHVSIGKVIAFAIAFLLFLIVTNPSLIPFLPLETKSALRNTWSSVFGDVEKVASMFVFNWITVFKIIAIILLMVFVTLLLQFIFEHIHLKNPKAKSTISLLRSAISYITTFVTIFWCIAALGVNIGTIFAGIGIVALIIGFGAQSLVEDLVTGIFLVFEDEFNVGDIIEVNDFRGTVESIGIRTTAIRDVGKNLKIFNNSDLRNILNRSTQNSVSVTTVSISYACDLEKTEKVIEEFLPEIREKYSDVFLDVPKYKGVQELGESGVLLKFTADVHEEDIFKGQRLLNREIKVHFDKAGIEIPFNQIVVHEGSAKK